MSLAELFYAKHPRPVRSADHPRRRSRRHWPRRVLLEPLEPRLLLSTTPEVELLDKLDADVASQDALVLTLETDAPAAPASDTLLEPEVADTGAFPVPLGSVAPSGSLVYRGTLAGSLDEAGEIDTFTLNVEAGQVATVVLSAIDPIVSQVELLDPSSASLGTAAAAAAGGAAALQTVPVTAGGVHTLRLTTLGGTGRYELDVWLNAAVETEALGGAANDTIASAQTLGAAGAVALQGSADRLAVAGVADGVNADGPLSGDFFAFDLAAGQIASLAVEVRQGAGNLALALADAAGNVLAAGVGGAENVDEAIPGFVAPAAGTYYGRVTGDGDYTLVVTRGAAFELEENDTVEQAQDLTGIGQVLGSLVVDQDVGGGSGTSVALGINLFDGSGFRWDITGTGSIGDGTSDAYDGGLNHSGFTPGFATALAEDGGREIVIGPRTIGSFDVTRKIFVPTDQAFARYLELVTNQGATTATYRVAINTDLGADSSTVVVSTASGDTTFGTNDDWIVTDDTSDGGGDPTTLHVIAGPGGQRPVLAFRPGTDDLSYSWDLSLAPGQTKAVMHFAAQNANRATALAKALVLIDLGPEELAGLSAAERSLVVNFVSLADQYTIEVAAGDHLTVSTSTPGGGAGEPANTLDPRLELFDPSGARVATNDNGAADGRNALLTHDAAVSGTYVVRVVPAGGSGAYTLRVEGATGALAPFAVVASSVADGSTISAFPSALDLTFSTPVLLPSLAAADLTVNGTPATAVTVLDDGRLRFDVSGAAAGDGSYDVAMAAGALTDIRGRASDALALDFTVDTTSPVVTASSIANAGVVAPGPLTFTATFSEDLAAAGLDAADVTLLDTFSGGAIAASGFSYDPATDQVTISFPALTDSAYRLTLASGAAGFRDTVGNALNGAPSFPLPSGQGHPAGDDFVVDFAVDTTSTAYPTPLVPKAPAGSLIHDPVFSGAFHAVGDVDSITLDLDAAQALTVVLDPAGASLRGRIELFDPSGASIASADAAADGATVVIQTAPVVSAGTYRIEATGIAGTGRYGLGVLLNAAAEGEDLGLGGNDTLATAQELVRGLSALDAGADTLAVVGAVGPTPDQLFSVDPFSALLRRVDPDTGVTLATLDITLAGRTVQGATALARHPITGELWAVLKLQGQGGRELVRLDLTTGVATSVGDSGDNFAALAFDATGTLFGVTGDGATTPETLFTLSTEDGTPALVRALGNGDSGESLAFDPVSGLLYHGSGQDQQVFESLAAPAFDPTAIPLSGLPAFLDMDALTYWPGRNTLLLVGDQRQLADLDTNGRVGAMRHLDHASKGLVVVPFAGSQDLVDVYRITFAAGQLATIVVEGHTDVAASVELLDAAGARLTTAVAGPSNVDAAIRDFAAPTAGTYFLRVTASRPTDYSLVVTRSATFELEPDDPAARAQDVSVTGQVLGHLGAEVSGTGTAWNLPVFRTDGEGFFWDIQGNGEISDGSQNAYDGAVRLFNFGSSTTAVAEDGGREIMLGPRTMSGMQVSRTIFVPEEQGWARFIETVTNPGTAAATFLVTINNFLGSSASTVVVGTSSGDTVFDPADDWIVTDDTADGSGTPAILHVFGAPEGQRLVVASMPSTERVQYAWDLALGPGETRRIMHFAAQNATRADALAKAQALAALGLDALAGMTESERASVVNFVAGERADHYTMRATEGDTLVITTVTPGGGAGEPVNDIDPVLELFDPSGVLVASNDNGAALVSVLGEQDFADGTVVGSNDTWLAAQAGEPDPFSIIHTAPAQIQFTHTGLEPGPATLTFSLWDLDSGSAGNQVTAFSLDGVAQDLAPFEANEADVAVKFFQFPVAASLLSDGQLAVSLTVGDPAGNEVGIDFSRLEVGRNARIEHVVPAGAAGTYRIVVRSAAGEGAYALRVSGATAAPVPFTVVATDPANDEARATFPAVYRVDFSAPVLLTSAQGGDLLVNGVAATGVTPVDHDTLDFAIAGAAAGEGIYAVAIAAGAVTSLSGLPLEALSSRFFVDSTPPRVVQTSVAGGVVAAGPLTVDVEFSEAMATAGLGIEDLTLVEQFSGDAVAAASVTYDDSTRTAAIQFDDVPEGDYRLTLVSGLTAFRDVAGGPLDGDGNSTAGGDFVLDFAADAGDRAYPVPLEAKPPLAALIHDPLGTGALQAGDTDTWTIDLDAGQSITAVLSPADAALQPALTVRDPDGDPVATVEAPGAGQPAVIQSAVVESPGTYRIVASSAAGAGLYTLRVVLNASLEEEDLGLGANDTLASADDLGLGLRGLPGGAGTLAVLGSVGPHVDTLYAVSARDASLRTVNPETGATLGTVTITVSGTTVNGATGLTRHPVTGDLWALLKLSGQSGRELVTVDPATGIATRVGNTGSDFATLAFGADGTLYAIMGQESSPSESLFTLSTVNATPALVRALGAGDDGEALALNPLDGLLYHASGDDDQIFESIDPATLAVTPIGLSGALEDEVEISALTYWPARGAFLLATQGPLFDLGPDGVTSDPRALDNDRIKGLVLVPFAGAQDLADVYRLTLDPDQSATIVVTGLGRAEPALELLDAVGALLTTGLPDAHNVDAAIRDFVAPAGGTFFLRVTAPSTVEYSLVVTRGAAFDLEPNGEPETAQDIGGIGRVLGHVRSSVDVVPGPGGSTPVSLSINLFDGTGFLWDIQQNGNINNGTSDAYDGGLNLSVAGAAFPSTATGLAEDAGREIVIGPTTLAGLTVSRKIFVPSDQGYARFLEVLTNPGSTSVTASVQITTNLGSDGSESGASGLIQTSSGDRLFTTDDDWIVTDDSDGGGDPSMAHVIAGLGGQRPSEVLRDSDSLLYRWDVTLAPGETRIVMHFGAQHANRAAALAKAPALAVLDLGALAGMTPGEIGSVLNFGIDRADGYSVAAREGDQLVITTATPGDGTGEPANTFDPVVELHDPSGALVATDDDGAADGRNARLEYTVPAGAAGTYRATVRSAEGTGVYVLDVAGATGGRSPFVVTATDPADGALLAGFPATYRVDLSEAVLLPTLRRRKEINVSTLAMGFNAVVPVAMEGIALDVDGLHLVV